MKHLMKHVGLAVAVLTLSAAFAGPAKANLLVNGSFETGDFTGWQTSNLTATFLTAKSFLPGMIERRAGSIITISSSAGRLPERGAPTPYAAANVRTEGWHLPGFNDADWPNVKAWVSAGGLNLPWRETVWDSVVEPHLRGLNRPIRLTVGGNVRDYMSMEGYPVLETKRTAMRIRNEAVLGSDPTDDARFLRYPSTYPLGTGGTQQGPVGAPPGS